ncbi:DUF6029 family protein [bacterium]|nr:DUF6029 family protein [bacterium]
MLGFPRGRSAALTAISILLALSGAGQAVQAWTLPIRAALRSRYGDGQESTLQGILKKNDKQYFENRLDLDFSSGGWEGGLSVESREHAEFSDDFTRLRKGYIQYTGDKFMLRGGTLYTLVGRGLTLDLHEDRVIDFDNTVRGFMGQVDLGSLRVMALGGWSSYMDYRSPKIIDDHSLVAAALEYRFSPTVSAGLSALRDHMTGRTDHLSEEHVTIDTDIPVLVGGPHLEVISGAWEVYLESSWKHSGYNRLSPYLEGVTQAPIRQYRNLTRSVDGAGVYGTLSWAGDKAGLTFEYKNYQYNVETYCTSVQTTGFHTTGASIFQYPPTVYKEHLYHLLNRYPITSNPDNEIGMQLEFNLTASEKLDFQAVASLTSDADLLFPPAADHGEWRRKRTGFPLLPSVAERFDPRWDTFIDIRWHPDDNLRLQGGYGYRRITEYMLITRSGDRKLVHTLPVQFEWLPSPKLSLHLDLETQHMHDKGFPYERVRDNWFNNYAAFGVGWNQRVILTVGSEFTGKKTLPGESSKWPFSELSVRLTNGGSFNLFYGSQREGLICSNGLCKYMPGFKGLRAEMSLFF